MLYIPQLNNFIAIADAGSFNKAAQYLNITSTALTKQIKQLEDELKVQLFVRSFRGLSLTEAGHVLYKEGEKIINMCDEAEKKTKDAQGIKNMYIRMGTSIMSPAQFLIEGELWKKLREREPDIEIEFFTFENTPENAKGMFQNLGKDLDVVTGIYDTLLLKQRNCQAAFLSWERFCVACPPNHPLGGKKELKISDLYGYSLHMMHRAWSSSMDELRDELEQKHPEIHICDTDFYNARLFNECEKKNTLLLTIEKWNRVNPFLMTIPVDWNYGINYGILYGKEPGKAVRRFLRGLESYPEK